LGNIRIKVIYFFDTKGNRLTNIIIGGLCYIFDNFLTQYEIDKRLTDITNFDIENEEKLLTEEEFRGVNLQIDLECEVTTNFIIH